MLGIFDSGIGGLTIVRALRDQRPDLGFVYLGDTARVPYGNRSPEIIQQFAKEDVEQLIAKGATQIVIACNTVSAIALSFLQTTFPDVKFIDVITPVAAHVASLGLRRVGVIGTRATINAKAYEKALFAKQPALEVYARATPLFVPLIEEGWTEFPETQRLIRRSLTPLRAKQLDALILGCTHYPMMQKHISRAFQTRVQMIDTPAIVAAFVLETWKPKDGSQTFIYTDASERVQALANKWLAQQ